MLCQVSGEEGGGFMGADEVGFCGSYDLQLDQRLSEETTVLVESYTVSLISFPVVGGVMGNGPFAAFGNVERDSARVPISPPPRCPRPLRHCILTA